MYDALVILLLLVWT